MKRLQNTRKRLVITRVTKPATPPKLQIQNFNELKHPTIHSSLAQLDTNQLRIGNPSLYRKQQQRHSLIRYRSISCLDQNRPTCSPLHMASKFSSIQNKQKAKPSAQNQFTALVYQVFLKQHGIFLSKNNTYCIPKDTLAELLFDYGWKIRDELEKDQIVNTQESCSTKDNSSPNLSNHRNIGCLAIMAQFSVNLHAHPKILSHQREVIHLKLEVESQALHICFENTVNRFGLQPTQEIFSSLARKLEYLQEEIKIRQNCADQLFLEVDRLIAKIQEKQKSLEAVQQEIKSHKEILGQVQKQLNEMEVFALNQPNRILQQEAEGYKLREQELFDLAFQLEQSSIQSIDSYVEESIMVPFQSFKLTLQTFLEDAHSENHSFLIPGKEMKAFSHSITTAYDSTIEKLKSIITTKATKIRDFVRTMRRLASYTIGKRQYLQEINRKMASAFVTANLRLENLRQKFPSLKNVIEDLQKLFDAMKNIYCEAEIFY